MATPDDGYMLRRDSQESKRLNVQHEFMVALSGGHLVHPSIPCSVLQAVADVATGTGIWLRDVEKSLAATSQAGSKKTSFVGFDISPQQFPLAGETPPNLSFVTHDMTEPFPSEYHETFDLVSVRLVSYVVKAADLEKVVRHILQILRPGGYLQWLECDAGDSWTIPETTMATTTTNYVLSEKVARGLLPGIATPLAKTIMSHSIQIPDGQFNSIGRSAELMRITQLETISSLNHPSPAVAASKKLGILSAAVALLEASASRRKATLRNHFTSSIEAEKLVKEMESINGLIAAIKRGEDQACNNWEMEMTLIVARKAIIVTENEPWMSTKYAI